VLVLNHSPLVGPVTWSLVANDLHQLQVETVVPTLVDDVSRRAPFWKQHVEAVTRELDTIPQDTALALVGHSGAGALLPAIGHATNQQIAAYIFVDAGNPIDGMSRLELLAGEDPDFAQSLEQLLATGGTFPDWSEEDLASVVPDPLLRRELVGELRPRALDFFSEPIPVFDGWPDAPCGYLQFGSAYDAPASRAREAGWRYMEVTAGHFHMLVDPQTVARALLNLI
jgi:hypothetical protein